METVLQSRHFNLRPIGATKLRSKTIALRIRDKARSGRAETMLIGELARLAGASVQAVRLYERRGLMGKPERTASGYRV